MMRSFTYVLLAGWFALASCGRKASTGISVDSALRPYVPPDANVLAGLNVDQLKKSPFYQRYENKLNFPLFDAGSERIGLDPRRDLSNVLVAWTGKQSLFIARGRFNAPVVQKKLIDLGVHIPMAFPKSSIVLASSTQSMVDAATERNGSIPEELQQRLQSIPRGDELWLVSRG
ncbi:MAG: hypothetical protein JO211_10750, partial [Acidobacteriaceae bacterium]|nr:hypothetical protein [Acidobacteriaceae bacterium]